MVIGSRALEDEDTEVKNKKHRKFVGRAFSLFVQSLFFNGIADTQCGFKLMTLTTGIALYNDLHLKRWTNDVEALYRAKKLGIPVSEMVISWEDKDGSKLSSSALGTVWVSLVMLFEILYMRLQYILGRWKI